MIFDNSEALFFFGGWRNSWETSFRIVVFHVSSKMVKMGLYLHGPLSCNRAIRYSVGPFVGFLAHEVDGFRAARDFRHEITPCQSAKKKSSSKNNAQNHPKQTKHWNFNGWLFRVIFLAQDIPTNQKIGPDMPRYTLHPITMELKNDPVAKRNLSQTASHPLLWFLRNARMHVTSVWFFLLNWWFRTEVIKWDTFWGNQTMQIYGNFEGLPLYLCRNPAPLKARFKP